MALASWTSQGYPGFSGTGTYSAWLEARPVGGRVFVEVDRLADSLEVFVNGKRAGTRIFPPWRVEIGGLLRDGRNQLELQVTNSEHNRGLESPVDSGILGKVWIAIEAPR